MKEAAKTSVISRRWQKLPCLHFDGSQALLKLWEKVYEYWVCKLKKILDLEMARYVNIILKSCHLFGAAIDEFITLCLPSSSSLTSLILKQVNVSGEVLANFISNSPFLECLCAGGSRSLVHMRLVGPPLYLKHLEIIRCDHDDESLLILSSLINACPVSYMLSLE
ncbi:hypothetical protein Godav_004005, partial [Gossypium davidsonii]|nr:hypothetical protein [Gossypium davidsonii]